MKILLIEDDKKISMALGIRLKSFGYMVSSSPDAISAVSEAVKFQPDLAIIDINLPGGDGFIVAERLQALANTTSVPLIFITASKKNGLRDRATSLGAAGFLEKPFDSAQLLETIESTNISGSLAWAHS